MPEDRAGSGAIDPLRWLPLACKVARRFGRYAARGLDYEDLEAEAFLTLCRAARYFRGDEARFQPYASMHIRNALLKVLDARPRPLRVDWRALKWARECRAGRLDEASLSVRGRGCLRAALVVLGARGVGEHMTEAGTLDFVAGREAPPWARLERAEVLAEVGRLPPRQRKAVRATLGLDGGPGGSRAAGAALGCSDETARTAYREAIAELRRRLGEAE
jgi:RNA polymerase sigma factor (sigma-70 family)